MPHLRPHTALLIALVGFLAIAPAAGAVVRSGGGTDPAGDGTGVQDITAAQMTYDTGTGRIAGTATLNGDPAAGPALVLGMTAGTLTASGSCEFPAGLLVTRLDAATAVWAREDTGASPSEATGTAVRAFPGGGQVAIEATTAALAGQGYNCIYVATQPPGSSSAYDSATFALTDPPVAPAPVPAAPAPAPRLTVKLAGVPKSVRRNRTAKARVTVTNTGTATARKVRLAVGSARGLSRRLGKSSLGSISPGKRVTTTLRVRLSRKARGTTRINVAATATGLARVRQALALKVAVSKKKKAKKRAPKPAGKLAGRLFWNFETPMPSLRSPDIQGVVFVNSRYAYFSLPKGGIPRCTSTTAKYDKEGELESGCVRYRYNERTGALVVGKLRGSYRKGRLVLGDKDIKYMNTTIPKAGARYDTKLIERTYFGLCGLVTGCTTTQSNLLLSRNGQFVLSDQATTTTGGNGTGVPYVIAGNYPPDQTGRYEILAGARIRFTFANGTVQVRTIAIDHDEKTGKPDIVRKGLLLDDGWYYQDD